MITAVLLRFGIYDYEPICLWYSPDFPKIMPVFAVYSLAFKRKMPLPTGWIGQWFQLDIATAQYSMDRLKEYLNCPNYPFMECPSPPQPIQPNQRPNWPQSRVCNGNVQLLIEFQMRSVCAKTGLIWCMAEKFPPILDTNGRLFKILGDGGRGEGTTMTTNGIDKFWAWCQLRRHPFAETDWKIADITKIKKRRKGKGNLDEEEKENNEGEEKEKPLIAFHWFKCRTKHGNLQD